MIDRERHFGVVNDKRVAAAALGQELDRFPAEIDDEIRMCRCRTDTPVPVRVADQGQVDEGLLRVAGPEIDHGLCRFQFLEGFARRAVSDSRSRIAAELGQLEEARALLQVLAAEPRMGESGSVAGQVEYVRAELAWAEGQPEEALRLLHRALDLLLQRGAVMDAARIHLRLAKLLARPGDQAAAWLELSAAEEVFGTSGAEGYLVQCRRLRDTLSA
ncbi:hypothetical protein [Thauera sp. 2A1]|uniref:hypothetical protein n=1 Tax=Thauera sp. 2A1 TaxID=2570191 RepID=UPI001290B0AA|nr:hypothetical protein [Thauera sp. 2A1]KAI5913935.1 hypothetical protein GH664_15935 [Thauera sp. 2A1]